MKAKQIKVYDGSSDHRAHLRQLKTACQKMNEIRGEMLEAFKDTGIVVNVPTFMEGWVSITRQLDVYIGTQPRPLQESVSGYLYTQLNKLQIRYAKLNPGMIPNAPAGYAYIIDQVVLEGDTFVPIEVDPTLWDKSIPQSLHNDLKGYVDTYNRLYDTYGKKTADSIVRNGVYPDKRDGMGSPIRERMGVEGIGALVKFLGL